MTFGERLKSLRKELQVTQKELASTIGVGLPRCNMWEHGSSPNQETLCKLANYFNTTTDYLLGNSNNRYKTKEQAEAVLIERETEILEKLEICKADIKELHEMIDATLFSFEKLKAKE